MGLHGGKTGAKAHFLEKFSGAFRDVKRLKDVREILGARRSQTLAVLDGNVMMNAMPSSVDTFSGYVSLLSHQLEEAVQAAAHVVVVFDEPAAMTTAKRDEQRRRDAQRQARVPLCSEDLMATITNDNYTLADLQSSGCNVKLLMEFRKARPRLYDAVCVALMQHFRASMTGGEWSLTFDGVDARGADRPFGAPREVGALSNDQAFWGPLLAREVRIGEGDIKLTDVTQRVHDAARVENTPVHGVLLNLVVTIDTDSFVIELLQQDRRARRPDAEDRDELTVLCLKERSRKRAGDDFVTNAHYTCCDMALFREAVLGYFYGTKSLGAKVVAQQPAALALLAVALALCGCDFVELKGMRFDKALPVVRGIVRDQPHRLQPLASVGALEVSSDEMLDAASTVDLLIDRYKDSLENAPRMKRALASVSRDRCDAHVLRALWTCAYWNQHEFRECAHWGFSAGNG
ncbi:MAG: hypothetical protein CMI29_06710 [Opitutae bacterium]|nr:hypothetical protein [Opitutae bacterium]